MTATLDHARRQVAVVLGDAADDDQALGGRLQGFDQCERAVDVQLPQQRIRAGWQPAAVGAVVVLLPAAYLYFKYVELTAADTI